MEEYEFNSKYYNDDEALLNKINLPNSAGIKDAGWETSEKLTFNFEQLNILLRWRPRWWS